MAHEGKEVIWHKEQTDKATVSTELQIVGLLPSVSLTIYLKETNHYIFRLHQPHGSDATNRQSSGNGQRLGCGWGENALYVWVCCMLYIIASPDVVNRSQMRHFKKPHDRFSSPHKWFSHWSTDLSLYHLIGPFWQFVSTVCLLLHLWSRCETFTLSFPLHGIIYSHLSFPNIKWVSLFHDPLGLFSVWFLDPFHETPIVPECVHFLSPIGPSCSSLKW